MELDDSPSVRLSRIASNEAVQNHESGMGAGVRGKNTGCRVKSQKKLVKKHASIFNERLLDRG